MGLTMRLFSVLMLTTLSALLAAVKPARAADGVAPDQATFSPGKETKIIDAQTGGVGWYVVYVPKDYTPEQEWPTTSRII